MTYLDALIDDEKSTLIDAFDPLPRFLVLLSAIPIFGVESIKQIGKKGLRIVPVQSF